MQRKPRQNLKESLRRLRQVTRPSLLREKNVTFLPAWKYLSNHKKTFHSAGIRKMTQKNIPTPVCSTCKVSGGENYTSGETSYLCRKCGTEMRYMPAGELFAPRSSDVKKNNGWITTFSMTSSELYSGRAMCGLGTLILILALSFLYFQEIGLEAALWSSGSGILLIILGTRKLKRLKKKMQTAMTRYPYWKK